MVECCNSLAKYLEDQGPNKAMDVDELLLRESMDVIGESQQDLATGFPPQLPGRSKLWLPQCGLAMLFQPLICVALQYAWSILQQSIWWCLCVQTLTSAHLASTAAERHFRSPGHVAAQTTLSLKRPLAVQGFSLAAGHVNA